MAIVDSNRCDAQIVFNLQIHWSGAEQRKFIAMVVDLVKEDDN
jgi:hypothetical protein